jgi:hypothetical protein
MGSWVKTMGKDGKIPMKNGGFHGKVMGTIHENGENGRISPFNMVIFWEY